MKVCKEHIANPVHVYRECAGCELKALREERDQARAECEALRKDAERYRWLRDEASPADVEFFSHQSSHGFENEVDAAMSKETGQ